MIQSHAPPRGEAAGACDPGCRSAEVYERRAIKMRPGAKNVIQITRPVNGIRRARVQRGCVIRITAPIDSFLYMCGPAEESGLLATQEVAMEKNFEMIELSLDDLASVSGCGDAADAGTAGGGRDVSITCPAGTYVEHKTTTNQDGSRTVTFYCSNHK